MSLENYPTVNQELQDHIKRNIIPLYDHFDKAHQRNHVTIILRTIQYGMDSQNTFILNYYFS